MQASAGAAPLGLNEAAECCRLDRPAESRAELGAGGLSRLTAASPPAAAFGPAPGPVSRAGGGEHEGGWKPPTCCQCWELSSKSKQQADHSRQLVDECKPAGVSLQAKLGE